MHLEKGKKFDQITEWLDEKGYLSVRGKKFKGNHVHSKMKKKRLKDEKLAKQYPEVRSDFYLDIFDKTLISKLRIDRLEGLFRNLGAGVFRVGQIRK